MGKKKWLIPLALAAVLTAALAVPLLSVGAPPSQAVEYVNGDGTPTPAPSPTPVPPQGESSNDAGVGKDVYTVDEIVYATGSGFTPNGNVNVFIWYDITWTDGLPIPGDVSGGMTTVQTGGDGTLGPANVWPPPLTPGDYDMVFDANQDGFYNAGDVVDSPNPVGFRVIGPVGGIVEPVDPSEPGATSGESLDGASTTTFVAVGIGLAVLLSAFLVWTLRRGRAASAGKSQ